MNNSNDNQYSLYSNAAKCMDSKIAAKRVYFLRWLFIAIFMHCYSQASHAVSFVCNKNSSFVERSICSDPALSSLDDALNFAYKKALATRRDTTSLKLSQRNWLNSERNKCEDLVCINQAYTDRLSEINRLASTQHESNNAPISSDIVLGRCHMDSCWWWKVIQTNLIRSEQTERLVKLRVRTTTKDYSSKAIEENGYPDYPPKNSKWEGESEAYIFCSKQTPSYIEFDNNKGKYIATIPFNEDGAPSGASEGISNLYMHICRQSGDSRIEIKPELSWSELQLNNPLDIFAYVK